MALEIKDFSKKVLTAEATESAKRNIAIAYVLIDLLSGKLSSEQVGEYEVTLAQEIYPTDQEDPIKSLDKQIGFVVVVEDTINSVKNMGKETIDGALSLLIKQIEETKRVINESEISRQQYEASKSEPRIVKIIESRMSDNAKTQLLKSIGIKLAEVVLNIEEQSYNIANPLSLLSDFLGRTSQGDKTNKSHRKEGVEQNSIEEIFSRFFPTSKRVIQREELSGGLYPLDKALYDLLSVIVNSKERKISSKELRKKLNTNYTLLTKRLVSTLSSTELLVEEVSGFWIVRVREDYDPSQIVTSIGNKQIIDAKKTKASSILSEETVLGRLDSQGRTNSEIVALLIQNSEAPKGYTKETVENEVYKALTKLIQDGVVERSGKGVRGNPFKYKLIKSEIPEVENDENKLEEETPTQDQPDISLDIINVIRQEFESKGHRPPTQADIENPQRFNIFAERFFELFGAHDDALTRILEWGDLPGSDNHLDLLNKLFSYSPRSVSRYMLPKVLIRTDTERELTSAEVLQILEVPYIDEPQIRKTSSAFVPGEEVEVTTYRLIKFPNIRIGFALSKTGSKVFANLSGKSVEINRVAGKLWDILNQVSTAKNSSKIVSGHVIHPINKAIKALKVKANNAVRIYYTVGPVTSNGDDLPEERELFVWGMTDKDEQLEVLADLSYDSIATLRDALSQTRKR